MAITFSEATRRSFLYRLGILGAGQAILGGVSGNLAAAPKSAGQKPDDDPAASPASKIWSNEYWAQKGDVKLYMFRKRLGAPQRGRSRAARAVSGARLFHLRAVQFRSDRSRPRANIP